MSLPLIIRVKIGIVRTVLVFHHIIYDGIAHHFFGKIGVPVTVEVASLEQLNALINRICKIQGVISAERTGIV